MRIRPFVRYLLPASSTLAVALLVLPTGMLAQTRAEDLFQQALRIERISGDLEEAIRLYQQVVETGNRAFGARALIRVAESYEKLGQQGARSAYTRIIQEFGDQTEQVALARERLAALEGPAALERPLLVSENLTTRLVWEGPGVDHEARPSPDGRYLAFPDEENGGNLALRDLQTGETRFLTADEGPRDRAFNPSFSNDGSRVAYAWAENGYFSELRVVGTDGSGQGVLLDHQDWRIAWADPFDWAPDDKAILVRINFRNSSSFQWALISVEDGSRRLVRDLGEENHLFSWPSLSPDGRWIVYHYWDGPEAQSDIRVMRSGGGGDRALVSHPAYDRSGIFTPDGRYVLFISDRSGTFDLWALPFRDGTADGEPFLVKRGFGRGGMASDRPGFTDDGSMFYKTEAGGGDIYTADFDPATGTVQGNPVQAVQGFQGHNDSPHWSSGGGTMVYFSGRPLPDGQRQPRLVVRDLVTGEETIPADDLQPNLNIGSRPRVSPDATRVLLGNAGHWRRDQGFLLLDVNSGEWGSYPSREDSNWFTDGQWTRDGNHIVYNANRVEGETVLTELRRRQIETGSEEIIHDFQPRPALRLWALSPDEEQLAYVDKAEGSGIEREFQTGSLRVVDLATGEAREIYQDEGPGISSAVGLTWTPDGEFILFGRNLQDRGMSPKLREVMSIPASGGEARSTGLIMEEIRHLSFLPDGQRIGFAAGPFRSVQIWMMENMFSRDGGGDR